MRNCDAMVKYTLYFTAWNTGWYPALDLFEQLYCTDWIILVVYDHSPKYSFSGTWFMLSKEKKLYQYKCDRDSWHHGHLLEWRLFLIFSGKLAVVLDFLTFQDKHNICTLSVNITFIWTRGETGKKARRTSLFSCF